MTDQNNAAQTAKQKEFATGAREWAMQRGTTENYPATARALIRNLADALLSMLCIPVADRQMVFSKEERNDALIAFAVELAKETLGKAVTPEDYVAAGIFLAEGRQARAALASAPIAVPVGASQLAADELDDLLSDPNAMAALADGLESIKGNENAALAAVFVRREADRLATGPVAGADLTSVTFEGIPLGELHKHYASAPVADERAAQPPAAGRQYHLLKTDPEVFQAVLDGAKTFEIRMNDRGYAVGDVLGLRETKHTGAEMRAGAPLVYTGRECQRFVSHILTGYGLADGWCCLSFDLPHAGGASAPVANAQHSAERIADSIIDNFRDAGWAMPAIDSARVRDAVASAMLNSAPQASEAVRDAALTPLLARALAEWHEDDGPVTWWAWCGHEWAGEAPWCGTPLDQGWPGYHTHWTPIPGVPAALSAQPGAQKKGGSDA